MCKENCPDNTLRFNVIIKECTKEEAESFKSLIEESGALVEIEVSDSSRFNVILKQSGLEKLSVVKLVYEITGLGLREAKELVDTTPSIIKNGCEKKEAEALKFQFETKGAEIEIEVDNSFPNASNINSKLKCIWCSQEYFQAHSCAIENNFFCSPECMRNQEKYENPRDIFDETSSDADANE